MSENDSSVAIFGLSKVAVSLHEEIAKFLSVQSKANNIAIKSEEKEKKENA